MSSTPTGSSTSEVLVGVAVRAHGLRGEVVVEIHTDSPEERFAPGSVLTTRSSREAGVVPTSPIGPDPAGLIRGPARTDSARRASGTRAVDSRSGSPGRPPSQGGVGTGVLTVESARPHSGRLLVRFAEVSDRDAAEALRGTQLLIATAALPPPEDPDEFHVHQLEGLRAELEDGSVVGTVREVVHGPGGELLVLARPELPDALVPFVRAIVPTVDLDGGRVVLTPPEGLLDAV
jgi:16S rRNA processing protein RimM